MRERRKIRRYLSDGRIKYILDLITMLATLGIICVLMIGFLKWGSKTIQIYYAQGAQVEGQVKESSHAIVE